MQLESSRSGRCKRAVGSTRPEPFTDPRQMGIYQRAADVGSAYSTALQRLKYAWNRDKILPSSKCRSYIVYSLLLLSLWRVSQWYNNSDTDPWPGKKHLIIFCNTFITVFRMWTLFISCSGKFSSITNRNLWQSLAETQTSGNTSTNKTYSSRRCKYSIIQLMLKDTVAASY